MVMAQGEVGNERWPAMRPRMVVGLGNPGARYTATRHNVGFMVADRLADEAGIAIGREKFGAEFSRGRIEGHEIILAKPNTFMNRSGPPVRALADFFQISNREVLVIHDDIDLDYGRLKIKEKGGHGGHNGIRSLIDAFGGGEFARLRVGIGRSASGGPVADFVLDRFLPTEAALLPQIISRARDAVITILCKGITTGMNQFNTKLITPID
jgi:PTH1 family peptidyl-tRNA hydrolase